MSSFQKSYSEKQEARKRPKVHFDESSLSSDSESQDFKNINMLSKLDAGVAVDVEKEYNYNSRPGKYADNASDGEVEYSSVENDGNQSLEHEGNRYSDDNDEPNENELSEYSDNPASEDNDQFSKEDNKASSVDNSIISSEVGENIQENRSNDNVSSISKIGQEHTIYFPLESTNRLNQDINSLNSGYNDFSDARRLPFIEKGVFIACQLLEENKAVLKEIKVISSETKILVRSIIPVIKDLTVEVLASREEIKKRNGLFTDVLSPDVQLRIKDIRQYDANETALQKHMIVDNMVSPNEANQILFTYLIPNVIHYQVSPIHITRE